MTRAIVLAAALLALPTTAPAQKIAPAATPPAAAAAFTEMKAMLGVVPGFFATMPADLVPALWEDFKSDFDPAHAIPGKYRMLISVAVAAQVPCEYCTYADSAFARLEGATDRELQEAALMAALTRRWSTILNGAMQDEAAFRKEIDGALAFIKKGGKPGAQPIKVVDAATAMKDVEQTFGVVPSFIKRVPAASLAGAWRAMKAVQFSETAIPGKYKELIGLAVAAQIPCRYCLYTHKEVARLHGATQAELDEAIAIAAAARQWSAYLYGIRYDKVKFKKEIDGLVKRMRAAATSTR